MAALRTRPGRWAATVVAVLVLASPALAGASKKRGPPPPPPVLTAGGISYAAIGRGLDRGLDQAGGYIEALDRHSGKQLWLLKVYENTVDPDMEADKQIVFITRLKLVDHRRALLVTDERGRRFRVDLASRSVMPLP